METEVWQRMREADDPDRTEVPADYHEARLNRRFKRFARALSSTFSTRCRFDTRRNGAIQDATFFGEVTMPAGGDLAIVVKVSSFAELASVFVRHRNRLLERENYDDALRARLEVVGRLLAEHGYVLIPDEAWRVPYDGRNHYFLQVGGSWGHRFFSYVAC